jgi:hypothetical protein
MRKNTMTKVTILAALGLVAIAFAAPRNGHKNTLNDPRTSSQRHVDLVIALDTSGSMDGLIDSARQKLWDAVNLLATAKPQPLVRVGLISYGNDGYSAESGWVRMDSNLTTDLDGLYSKLFALRTNGGTEYVARAVHTAVSQMQWDKDPDALKIIFVAGNEPATQDPEIPIGRAMEEATKKGIHVNAIYCGVDANTEAAGWRQVASLGAGKYAAINQDHLAVIATPMDGELARLSTELNNTYVAFGAMGGAMADNQKEQDKNAASLNVQAAATRAVSKSSGVYHADSWDLVDAIKDGKKDLSQMAPADLPAPMKAMSSDERKVFIEGKAHERAKLQGQINQLNAKREEFLKAEKKKHGAGGEKGFDDAFNQTIQTEAESSGFKF